jgi:hypothetical protein
VYDQSLFESKKKTEKIIKIFRQNRSIMEGRKTRSKHIVSSPHEENEGEKEAKQQILGMLLSRFHPTML